MKTNTQLEQLENAIRERAQKLADKQIQTAQQQREKIQADSGKRLTQWEEHETELAKATAEQEYRRRVQIRKIEMQADFDQLRWHLIQSVITDLQVHLKQLCQQETIYIDLLKQYLKQATSLLESEELVVVVNAQDYKRLAPQWDEIVKGYVSNKHCRLSPDTEMFIGGLLVRSQDDRIRIDNTFEGIITRFENELYQVITAQLFASATSTMNF